MVHYFKIKICSICLLLFGTKNIIPRVHALEVRDLNLTNSLQASYGVMGWLWDIDFFCGFLLLYAII